MLRHAPVVAIAGVVLAAGCGQPTGPAAMCAAVANIHGIQYSPNGLTVPSDAVRRRFSRR